MPAISVIVPVYNVEKYLHRCIDSILSQTFADFELLLIDDGSKDSSSCICDEYAGKDARIKVFHKKNGGVSSARNVGIREAQGTFLVFVDSDDCVGINYLKYLFPQQDEDFVMDSSDDISPPFQNCLTIGEEAITTALSGWQILCPWGKLFKSSIIKHNEMRYDETVRIGEDTLFNLNYLTYISSLRTTSSHEYNYTKEAENSLSKTYPTYKESVYKARKVYDIGKRLSAKYDDVTLERHISKYAGITWTLWHSLLPYSISDRALRIKKLFLSPEISSLMENYLLCNESGRKYALFYWLGKHKLFRIAGLIIP